MDSDTDSSRNSLTSEDFRASPMSSADIIQKVRRQSLLGRDVTSDGACVDSVAHLAQQVAAVARMTLEFNDEDIAFDDDSMHPGGHVFAVHSESVELGMPSRIAQLTDDAEDPGTSDALFDASTNTSSSVMIETNEKQAAAANLSSNEFMLYDVTEKNDKISITINEACSSQLSQGSVCVVAITGSVPTSGVLGALAPADSPERRGEDSDTVDRIAIRARWGPTSATDRITNQTSRLLYLDLRHIYQQCNIALAQAALSFACSISSAVLYVSAGCIADTDVHHVCGAASQAVDYYGNTHSPRLIWLEQHSSQHVASSEDIRNIILREMSSPAFSRSSSPEAPTSSTAEAVRTIYNYFDASCTTIVELQSSEPESDGACSHLLGQLAEVRYILLGQLVCRTPTSSGLLELVSLLAAVSRDIKNENEPIASSQALSSQNKLLRSSYRRIMSGLLREEFGGSEQQWKIDFDADSVLDGKVCCPLCRGGSEIIAAAKNVRLINELEENLQRRFDACHVQATIDAKQELCSDDDEDAAYDAEKQYVHDHYFLASLKANSAMLQVTMDSLPSATPTANQRRSSRSRSISTPTEHAEVPSVRLARYTDILLLYFNRSWGLASCHVMSHFLSDTMRSEDALWSSRVEQLESRVITQEAEQRELRRRVEALTTENMQLHESLENKMDKAIDVWAAAQTKQTKMEDEAKTLDAANKELKQQLEILTAKLTSLNRNNTSNGSSAVTKQAPPVGFADALKFVFACAAGMEEGESRPRTPATPSRSPAASPDLSNYPKTE